MKPAPKPVATKTAMKSAALSILRALPRLESNGLCRVIVMASGRATARLGGLRSLLRRGLLRHRLLHSFGDGLDKLRIVEQRCLRVQRDVGGLLLASLHRFAQGLFYRGLVCIGDSLFRQL